MVRAATRLAEPPTVREAWGQQPCSGQQGPQRRALVWPGRRPVSGSVHLHRRTRAAHPLTYRTPATHTCTPAHSAPLAPLHKQNVEMAHRRLQPTAAVGCGRRSKMRRKDAVPDASQRRGGPGEGLAGSEAAVARETRAGGRELCVCAAWNPPTSGLRGPRHARTRSGAHPSLRDQPLCLLSSAAPRRWVLRPLGRTLVGRPAFCCCPPWATGFRLRGCGPHSLGDGPPCPVSASKGSGLSALPGQAHPSGSL